VATTVVSRTRLEQTIGLLVWLLLTFLAAAVGAVASIQAAAFYAQLAKPSWAPPGWLFGPVWSALYLLMAVAAWLVWRSSPRRESARALALFLAQLAANALWTWLFFVWHKGPWAFTEVLLLWALIALCISAFWQRSRLAAALLLPYLVWVSFASALTWATWRMNLGVLG
jgi:tryptophan-rich sensory protein